MPTVSKEERVVRDATALHFWLDGESYRDIGRRVKLSCRGTELAVRSRGTSKSARSARHTSRCSVPSPVA